MTLKEAINELKAMKPHIESNMSVAGYDAYDMAIRGLELWDMYAEEVDDVYEDGKGETYLIREWIEDGGETTETVKSTAESSQNVPDDDLISRKAAIDKFTIASNQDGAYGYLDTKSAVGILNDLPSVQPEYEPVTAKDFANTMSAYTVYRYTEWHGEALALMKEQGFVICKKKM